MRRIACLALAGIVTALVGVPQLPAQVQGWQQAVGRAAVSARNARIVVLDLSTNRILASNNLSDAARTLAAPGSTLKPLILYRLLAGGHWNSQTRVACNRDTVIAGRKLACSHPAAPPFDAREALTWSCNTYFAEAARSLQPGSLGELLRASGVLGSTGLFTPEASAFFREPRSIAEEQLAFLGVAGIRVTPLELAAAYRWLSLDMASHPDSDAARTVLAALKDSATFGMASDANDGATLVAGKTGTAEGETTSRTHGWFVGLAPAQNPLVVVVVYLPVGRGADAARVAGNIFAHAPLEHR